MTNAKHALFAALALTGLVATSATASAMPVGGLETSSRQLSHVQEARWVCAGPYRCWWRPNVYPYYGAYGYYPGPRWWGPRRWHHWRRW